MAKSLTCLICYLKLVTLILKPRSKISVNSVTMEQSFGVLPETRQMFYLIYNFLSNNLSIWVIPTWSKNKSTFLWHAALGSYGIIFSPLLFILSHSLLLSSSYICEWWLEQEWMCTRSSGQWDHIWNVCLHFKHAINND